MSLLVNRQIQKLQRGNQLVLFYWSWGQIFILVCTFSGPHSVSFSIPFLRERALIRQIESESIRVKWIPNPPCVWCHAWTGADQCLRILQQMVCSTFRLQCLLEILWWFCWKQEPLSELKRCFGSLLWTIASGLFFIELEIDKCCQLWLIAIKNQWFDNIVTHK